MDVFTGNRPGLRREAVSPSSSFPRPSPSPPHHYLHGSGYASAAVMAVSVNECEKLIFFWNLMLRLFLSVI